MRQHNYRPGALNVQVNGIQIEDLYQEHQSYKRRLEELTADKERHRMQLWEQGQVIKSLKQQLAEKEDRIRELESSLNNEPLYYYGGK